MIKVNLATRKQASLTGETKTLTKSGIIRLDVNLDGMRDLPIRRILMLAGCLFVANYMLEGTKDEELARVNGELKKLQTEQTELKTRLAATKSYEEIKKQLDADELTIRSKIDTIKTLVSERSTPPKLLVALAKAIPNEVWLDSFKITDDEMQLHGSAMEFSYVSDFMKNINESAFFSEVRLINTQRAPDSVTKEDVAQFELLAKRRKGT